jgi:beta-glucosidase
MGYEAWHDGIAKVIEGFAARYPTLPLVVTEAGIASSSGTRRSENIVRILEATTRMRDQGIDLRGYYHWSLTDNFEWAEGFRPRFGLFTMDYSSYTRSPSAAVDVYKDIIRTRSITSAQRDRYGGTGPMTPEPGITSDPYCTKLPL